MRSALLGLAVAVAAVAGAVTFGANLLRLVDTPVLYGQTWDVAWDGQFGSVTAQQFGTITGQVPQITAVTFGVHGTVSIGGLGGAAGPATVIPAIGLAHGTGPLLSPTVLDGRAPRTASEIVLGTSVLRQFGLRVGQYVTVGTPEGSRPMLITGSAVFPYFGQGSFTSTDVGEGAETVASVLAEQQVAANGGRAGYNFALISFGPGLAKQAGLATVQRRWASFCASIQQSTCLVTSQRPNTVNNYAAIDGTPAVLAGVLALLGLGVLAAVHRCLGPPQAPRLRDTQGPRPAPGAAARGRPLAGLGGHRRRPGDRDTAWRGGRPLGLAGVRVPGRPVGRGGHPAPRALADSRRARRDRPGSAASRPPGRCPARYGHSQNRVTADAAAVSSAWRPGSPAAAAPPPRRNARPRTPA